MFERIDTPAARMRVTARVQKLCPIKDEVDEGVVTLSYLTSSFGAFELHSLADYLATFADKHMTHEAFVSEVGGALGVHVVSTWETAGMRVTCSSVEAQP